MIVSSPGLPGRPSIQETADGSTQLLRLHTCKSHRRYALHWRDQRPRSPRFRAQIEYCRKLHQETRCESAGLFRMLRRHLTSHPTREAGEEMDAWLGEFIDCNRNSELD